MLTRSNAALLAVLAVAALAGCTPDAGSGDPTATPVATADATVEYGAVTGELITPTVTEGEPGVVCVSDDAERDAQLTTRRHIPITGPDGSTVVGIARLGESALRIDGEQRRCVWPFTADKVELGLGFYSVEYRSWLGNKDLSWRTEAELFDPELDLFWGYGFMD